MEKLIFEYRHSTFRKGVTVLTAGIGVSAFLIWLGFKFMEGEYANLAIAWMILVVVIALPMTIWDGVRQIRSGDEFRTWISREVIGQTVPFADYGNSFEISVSEISAIRHVTLLGDDGARWVIELSDGRQFELCQFYGNNCGQIFKILKTLRPDVGVKKRAR